MDIKESTEIAALIVKMKSDSLTEEEKERLHLWLSLSERNRELYDRLSKDSFYQKKVEEEKRCCTDYAYERFLKRQRNHNRKQVIVYISSFAALFIIFITLFFKIDQFWDSKNSTFPVNQMEQGEVCATLYLSNGSKHDLNNGVQTISIAGNNFSVNGNKISVEVQPTDTNTASSNITQWHKLSVPKSGEYQLQLSDGTRVYLNSHTILSFPEKFSGKERRVKLDGEAYFEVQKDKEHRFIVETSNLDVCVYGTSFNVNTNYLNSIRTTLESGSVGIISHHNPEKEFRLEPLEMIKFDKDGCFISKSKVDPAICKAWKSGCFAFYNENLEEIMHTLALWYDVEVFIPNDNIKRLHFTGKFDRYKNIDTILDIICDIAGLDYSLNGKTITISE